RAGLHGLRDGLGSGMGAWTAVIGRRAPGHRQKDWHVRRRGRRKHSGPARRPRRAHPADGGHLVVSRQRGPVHRREPGRDWGAHPGKASPSAGGVTGQARRRGGAVVLFHEPRFPPEAETWDELYIVPLQDLHIGDPRFREDVFQTIKAWLLAAPNRYAIINGDLFNVA